MSSKSAEGKKIHRYGMAIDLDKCTGCGACVVACASENNVSTRYDESNKVRSITWMRLYTFDNSKPYPDTRVAYLPRPCMHCDHHTPCTSVCPPTATQYDPIEGVVSQIYTRCIGCRYCVAACPYHVRYFNWYDNYWPKDMAEMLNPDVSARARGVVEKCTFCYHRLQRAREQFYAKGERDIPEDAYIPACAEACPTNAILFGDLLNPDHKITKLLQVKYDGHRFTYKNPRAFRLLEKLGSEPKVFYLTSHKWVKLMGDNYLKSEIEAQKAKS